MCWARTVSLRQSETHVNSRDHTLAHSDLKSFCSCFWCFLEFSGQPCWPEILLPNCVCVCVCVSVCVRVCGRGEGQGACFWGWRTVPALLKECSPSVGKTLRLFSASQGLKSAKEGLRGARRLTTFPLSSWGEGGFVGVKHSGRQEFLCSGRRWAAAEETFSRPGWTAESRFWADMYHSGSEESDLVSF